MDYWVQNIAQAAENLKTNSDPAQSVTEAAQLLEQAAQAWSRYARVLSRLERHLKLENPIAERVIELEYELSAIKATNDAHTERKAA